MLLKLELKLDEINVILSGLGELPAKISMDIIEKIRNQAMLQINEKNTTENIEN